MSDLTLSYTMHPLHHKSTNPLVKPLNQKSKTSPYIAISERDRSRGIRQKVCQQIAIANAMCEKSIYSIKQYA